MLRLVLVSTLGLLLCPVATQAQGGTTDDQPIAVRAVTHVLLGKEKPAVVVDTNVDITKLSLELRRNDGRKVTVTHGPLAAGGTARLDIDQPQGTFSYEGRLRMDAPGGGTAEMPIALTAVVAGPMKVNVTRERLDLEGHTLVFTQSRPAGKAEVVVWGESGEVVGRGASSYDGQPPGTQLVVRWQQVGGTVLRLDLRAYDSNGFFEDIQLSPWSVEIPHEEVIFDFGKADIRPSEAPKLDATLRRLHAAVAKYGTLVQLTLYVAGHTDTVGSPETNLKLSTARAYAIARHLRAHGFTGPVRYRGFGESALAVATPDETPEERNRRAVYILAGEEPRLEGGGDVGWKPL